MKKINHSKEIQYLYDDTYFLGGKSKYTGQFIGVEGYQDFAEGKIYQKKIDTANLVDFKYKRILDIGFGRGELLNYCYQNGAKECIGIDYSSSAVEIADKYLPINISIYLSGVDELKDLPHTGIEIVYILDVLEHVTNAEWEICFKDLDSKLSKDAQLIAITPSIPSGDYLQMHNNYMTKENLNKLLTPYFSKIDIKNQNKWFYIKAQK